MTAIKQLREWFNRDKRPETSAWITGDTVETRAILELADRLEKLEGNQPIPVSPEPFKITGIGSYRTRSGQTVFVDSFRPDLAWPARGSGSWQMNGRYSIGEREHPRDIVEGPIADESRQKKEMAGIGFTKIEPTGDEVIYGLASWARHAEHLDKDATYVDWSKVPASAIVKPEPKRETRKVWVNFYRNRDDHSIWPSRSDADDVATSERIACVEAEITFTHGQGLEGGK